MYYVYLLIQVFRHWVHWTATLVSPNGPVGTLDIDYSVEPSTAVTVPVATAAVPPSVTTPTPTLPPAAYRLPKTLSPLHYNLALTVWLPDPSVAPSDEFKFAGNMSIDLACHTTTDTIVLHWRDMNLIINSLTLTSRNASDGPLSISQSVSLNKKTQVMTLGLSSGELLAGHVYTLSLQYTAKISTGFVGFYRSSYVEKGQKRWLAVTDFEPKDARQAFPCWDEPEFKATYSISLSAPAQYRALSNGIQTSNTALYAIPSNSH